MLTDDYNIPEEDPHDIEAALRDAAASVVKDTEARNGPPAVARIASRLTTLDQLAAAARAVAGKMPRRKGFCTNDYMNDERKTAMTATTEKGLHIVRLEVENVLPLKAVRIVPATEDGSLVKITGPNGAGKTSVLRAIWMALGGKDFVPEDVIREGESEASVELDIGDYIVRRVFRRREDGSIIESPVVVTDRKGLKVSSPQAVLRDLVGMDSFDPLAFVHAAAKEQVRMLQEALRLDFSALDAEYRQVYDDRRDVNRDLDTVKKNLQTTPAVPEGTPDQEIGIDTIRQKREGMQRVADSRARLEREIAESKRAHAAAVERMKAINAEIVELQAEERELETKAESMILDIKAGEESLAAHAAPDFSELDAEVARIEQVNRNVRALKLRRQREQEAAEIEKTSKQKTARLAEIQAQKEKMIAEKMLPVPGLTFGDDGVMLNGHPFANAGGAEQLRVAMALVMAANPRLRVMTMDEALGRLDDDSLAVVAAVAGEHDFQVWITGPRTVGEQCIEIRDGEVMAADG